MGNNTITKIYDLKSVGTKVLLDDLDQVNTKLIAIKENKIALNRIKDSYVEDPAKIQKAQEELTELIVQEKALQVELKKKSIAVKEQQLLRQIELEQQKKIKAGNEALAGSYYDVNKRYQELQRISKNTVNLYNAKEVKEATDELKVLKQVLDNYNRSLTKDGTLVGEYTTGIINSFKKMGLGDLIESQINQGKTALAGLDLQFDKLKQDLQQIRNEGGAGFEVLEKEMIQNRQQAEQLHLSLEKIENDLRGTGTIGEQITRGLRDGFKNAKQEFVSFFVAYLGFQQLLATAQSTVRKNAVISDQTTDLQRIMDITDTGLRKIEVDLRNLETRTPLEELLGFSIIAGKAGTAEKDIVGVTKAIDELKLVAGKELGQNIDQTVSSIVKLVNIFEGPGKVNEDNIRRYGNALIELANKGVASGEYLIDYAQRLAGIEGLTKIQIQSVLGLAAAYEEQGASAEVAATATTQILLKVNQNIDKYAELANVSKETFRELVRNNPAEALLQLAQGVKGNTQFFDEFAQLLPDLEVKGVRVASTFGIMADKADFFRDKIKIASGAINETAAITEGAERKQNNFAASVDKLRKQWELIGTSKGFQITLGVILSLLGFVSGNMGTIITLFTGYAAILAISNAAQIKTAIVTAASNVAFRAQYAALVLNELWLKAYAAALTLYVNRQEAATAAAVLFSEVIMANPLGFILSILGLVIAAYSVFTSGVNGTTEALRANARELLLMTDISRKAAEATNDETAKLRVLVTVASNVKNSYDTRRKAIDDLIKQYPQFSKALDGERIDLLKLRDAYNEVYKSIRLMAEAQASASLTADKQKSVLSVTALRQRFETESSIQGGGANNRVFLNDISAEDRKLLLGGFFGNDLSNNSSITEDGNGGISFFQKDTAKIVAFLKAEEAKRTKVYETYIDVSSKKQAELNEYQAANDAQMKKTLESKADSNNLTVTELKTLIEAIDKENLTLKEADPKLKENIDKRDALQERLDKALGRKTKSQKDSEKKQREQAAADRKAAQELKEEFKKQMDALEGQKIDLENAAKDAYDNVDADPTASDSQKAAAKSNYYSSLLAIQIAYAQSADALEKAFNEQSSKNEAARQREILKARRQSNKSLRESEFEAQENELQEIEDRYYDKLTAIQQRISNEAAKIFSSGGSAKSKKEKISLLENSFYKDIYDAEIDRINRLEAQYKYMLDKKLINEQEYNRRKADLDKQRYDVTKKFIDAEETEEEKRAKRRKKAEDAAYNIANTLAQGYISQQNAKIDSEYNEAVAFQDKEKQKRLALATSKEEQAAIESEYEQKKSDLEKKRAKERKALAEKELAIEFALASIKAISTSKTFYDGLFNESIVLGEYLAKLAVIEGTQFASGGKLTSTGGRAKGKPHGLGGTPFTYGGTGYEAEADEIFIINKKSSTSNEQITVSGTPGQIASAVNSYGGGVDFEPGATINSFSYTGNLGNSLQAPVFNKSGDANNDFTDIKETFGYLYRSLKAMSMRVDNLNVVLATEPLNKKQEEDKKAVKLGRI